MFGAKTLNRHGQLVNEMADTLGVDLPKALAEGRITGEGLRSAVIRCTGCEDPSGCEHWLEEHSGGADSAPGYCRNGALFAALKESGER